MVIQVPLINSEKVALVDDGDALLIEGYAWWEHVARGNLSYVYGMKLPRTRKGERVIKLHRHVMGLGKAFPIVDHIDGNGLNNCRNNLQIVTKAQNAQKANLRPENNPRKRHSKYRGVSFLEWHGRYLAYIDHEGKRTYLGYHDTAEEAARVRDAKAIELHGQFARLNFAHDRT